MPIDPRLTTSPGGWIRVESPFWPADYYARVFENPAGRLVIADLHVISKAEQVVGGPDLRNLPLGAIEARVNAAPVADEVRSRLNDKTPLMGVRHVLAMFEAAAQPKRAQRATREPRPVTRPAGRDGYDASFYKAVARRYTWLVSRGERAPAPIIAAEAGVPVSAVHRWILKARKLGDLPPAAQGRVG